MEPVDHIINITGVNEIAGKKQLIMTNGGNVEANVKDTVTWIIGSASKVKEIRYVKKDKTGDVFKDKPAKKHGSENWSGKIKDTLGKPKEEEDYTLFFVTTDGEKGDHDPKISVNN